MDLAGSYPFVAHEDAGGSTCPATDLGGDESAAEPWLTQLSFATLPRGTTDPRLATAYECWRSVWYSTFVELDHIKRLPSDDFTRQDEIAALFYAGRCIGLTGCRFVDLSAEMSRDDSYFTPWPASALDALMVDGPLVCIGNNMTVHPDWRGRVHGLSIKRLLMWLSIQRFLVSHANTLVGTMRNDRGMNKLVYELGFAPVVCGASSHGVEVDLVSYRRRSADKAPVSPRADHHEHVLALDLFARFGVVKAM